jgi:CSLREA domain-containing protein
MATFTVTSLADDGGGAELTLREAITFANLNAGADTIRFAENLSGRIVLEAGELRIEDSVVIVGSTGAIGDRDITIDAGGESRVLRVAADDGDIEVTLSGMALTGGVAGNGAGLFIRGEDDAEVTLRNMTVSGNVAIDGGVGRGGGAFVSSGSTLSVEDGLILNNLAATEGGGIWSATGATLGIDGTVIRGNVAQGAGADDGGGGVFNAGGTVTIADSDVSGNRATGASGSGGNLFSTNGTVTITDSTMNGGTANRAGGAIEIVEGVLSVRGASFDRNGTGSAPGNGGAVHSTGDAEMAFTDAIFTRNAAEEGGAIWNSATGSLSIENVLFRANTARGDDADQGGGAVFNQGGTVTATRNFFDRNAATGEAGSGGHILSVDGEVTIDDALMLAGRANRAGGAIEVIAGEVTISNADFSDNSTGPAPGNGGAIHVTADALTTILNSDFISNVASAEGGAIWNSATGTMVLDGLLIRFNEARGDAVGQGGGGVFNDGGTLSVDDSILSQNAANGTGGSGGHLLSVDGTVTVGTTTFEQGVAPRAGGAIEVIEGVLNVVGSRFEGNVTGEGPGNGGAIHVTGAVRSRIEDSGFLSNVAANEGGALWNSATGTMTILSAGFFDNESPSGGAVFSDGGATVIGTLADGLASDFQENLSSDGVVVVEGPGPLTMRDALLDDADPVLGSQGADLFVGGNLNDTVDGRGGNDQLFGGLGNDFLMGGAGADVLLGQGGENGLMGGAGADFFAFTAADGDGVGVILDFEAGDRIVLEDQLFGLGAESVNLRAVTREVADLAIARGQFFYNAETGGIVIDRDGAAGAGEARLLAVIDGGGPIGADDFLLA